MTEPLLPPLLDKLDRGPAGASELERLMHQLLAALGARTHFTFEPILGKHRSGGFDGIARDGGVPGFDGPVAFELKCVRDTLRKTEIERAFERAASLGSVRHWVLVTPRALSPHEVATLAALEKPGSPRVHHWGPERIEPLLRAVPALLARYYPDAARALLDGYDGSDFRELAAQYRRKIALVQGEVHTFGLPPEALGHQRTSPTSIQVKDIFVPLRFIDGAGSASPESLSRLLNGRSIVVLGDPGHGKSTLLSFLAQLHAGAATLDGVDIPERTIPLSIPLRDFARREQQHPGLSFLDYLEERARTDLGLPHAHRAFFESALRMGEAIVLLDGLDEVGGPAARSKMRDAIRTFRDQYPSCPFWVTSRIFGYTGDCRFREDEFLELRIGRLDDAQVDDFITRWTTIHVPHNLREREERKASLRTAVHRTPSVRRLASTPLLLMLMAFLHQGLRKLPQDRGELYEKCVELLLKTWQEAKLGQGERPDLHPFERLGLHLHTQKDYLAHLALHLQEHERGEGDEARGTIARADALTCLSIRHLERGRRERPGMILDEAREEMDHFLQYLCERTGLLIDRGEQLLSFIHLSFQEYLAAWVFTCLPPAPEGPAAFFKRHLGDPLWEEVLLLRLYLVLRAPGGGGPDAFDQIVAVLLRALDRQDSPAGWLFLARALRDDLEFAASERITILEHAVAFWQPAPRLSGTWFGALEDIVLFADKARSALQALLDQSLAAEDPGSVIANLHLRTRLFGFPEHAAEALRKRADLPRLLPDLVVFWGEAGVDALLAERAQLGDWLAAFRAMDSPALYRVAMGWTLLGTGAALPAQAMIAWIACKIAAEMRSRAAFASVHWEGSVGSLLTRAGTVRAWHSLHVVETPLTALRAPAAGAGWMGEGAQDQAAPTDRPLFQPGLASERLHDGHTAEATAADAPLIESVRRELVRLLDPFEAARTLPASALHHLAVTFVRTLHNTSDAHALSSVFQLFVRWVAMRIVHTDSPNELFFEIAWDWVLDFGHRLIASPNTEFIHTFGRTFGRTFGLELIASWNLGPAGDEVAVSSRRSPSSRDRARNLTHLGVLELPRFWHADLRAGMGPVIASARPGPRTCETHLTNPLSLPFLLLHLWSVGAINHFFALARRMAIDPTRRAPDDTWLSWAKVTPLDTFGTALAWEEHAKVLSSHAPTLTGAQGALAITHAAYAALLSGLPLEGPLWTALLEGRDRTDPLIEIAFSLHELCHFRDEDKNGKRLGALLASATPETRPLLEAAGLLSPLPASVAAPDSLSPLSEGPRSSVHLPLFSWVHLSDLRFGAGTAGTRWDRALVLAEIRKDLARHATLGIPAPEAIFVTGDLAFHGRPEEYAEATTWLLDLAHSLGLSAQSIFTVPGNHDVDLAVDGADRNLTRLVRALREGLDPLDDALAHEPDRALLTLRQIPYLDFARGLAPACLRPAEAPETRLHWLHRFTSAAGLRVRLVGLNTALLARSDSDKGKLRLGKEPLAQGFTHPPVDPGELVIVLSHHPLKESWLADQREASAWIQSRAQVHLAGHVHEADSEESRSGSGNGFIRVAAGAAHGEATGAVAGHGYNVAAVVPGAAGGLSLRLWPRRWSDPNKAFRADGSGVREGQSFAEHTLAVRLAAGATRR